MSDQEMPMQPFMFTGPQVPFAINFGLAEFDQPTSDNGTVEKVKMIVLFVETPTGSERYFMPIKGAKAFAENLSKFCTENDLGLTIADSIPDNVKPFQQP